MIETGRGVFPPPGSFAPALPERAGWRLEAAARPARRGVLAHVAGVAALGRVAALGVAGLHGRRVADRDVGLGPALRVAADRRVARVVVGGARVRGAALRFGLLVVHENAPSLGRTNRISN